MARYQRFEDLPVWQEAERLYGAVLDLLEGSPKGLSYGFRNQIDRASLSVSIRTLAKSRSKQIGAWMMSIERPPVKGKRHRTSPVSKQR